MQASKERARQRVAAAMKKKWQDPQYRLRQTEAIRTSHVLNPRSAPAAAGTDRATQARRSSKKQGTAQQSGLQRRLQNNKRAVQAALQELQETRAYHAKFEGVVSKLQAQVCPQLRF